MQTYEHVLIEAFIPEFAVETFNIFVLRLPVRTTGTTSMITNWKRRAIDNMAETFSSKEDRANKLDEAQLKDLHAKIGQLTIERDFLPKAFGR